jgi:hypothetical protein
METIMGAINTFTNVSNPKQGLAAAAFPAITRGFPAARQGKPRKMPLTVGGLLEPVQPGALPALLLGVCADSLPFLVELGDPEIGAILVSCEKGTGKTHQLQVMAESAIRLSAPSDLQVGILTYKPNEWDAWRKSTQKKKYLQGIYAWYDPWAEAMIQTLVDIAEARRSGVHMGANILLILDDLNFVEELSYEAQINLHWLLEYGSQSQLWVAGAINAHQAADMRYWVDPFKTRIIGRVVSAENAALLSLQSDAKVNDLEPALFRVRTGTDWITYRLPLLGR